MLDIDIGMEVDTIPNTKLQLIDTISIFDASKLSFSLSAYNARGCQGVEGETPSIR